ncbi:MAG TPA: hypothetical protein VK699_03460 [Terriglobales bacterium]|jgi:hypothetical protein|nr:hypothetical protein [Terriglobales bacterium]
MSDLKRLPVLAAVVMAISILTSGATPEQTIKGYLVDIACLNQRSSELTTLGPKHTKKCLTMPACERSGYAVLTSDLKVFKFDSKGNEEAKKLINAAKREADFRIVVSGNVNGNELFVTKLKLQK